MELPQFNFNTRAQYQHVIERDLVTEVRPESLINAENEIRFTFTLGENEFLFLNESYLYLRVKVKQFDAGKEVTGLTGVTPINYFLNTMFANCSIEIDNVEITKKDNMYAYKAWLEGLLGYGTSAKDSHMSSALWYDDENTRKARMLNGNEFDIFGRLHFDLSHQPRPIPGPHTIVITLTLNKPKFMFKCIEGTTAKLTVSCAFLELRRAIATTKFMATFKQRKTKVCLPHTRTIMRAFPIQKGSLDTPSEDVVNGLLPRRMYLFFVKSTAYNGDFQLDPLDVNHFNVNYIAAYVDGVQFPMKAYQPNFKHNHYSREYMGLMQTLNQNNTHSQCKIAYEDFKNTPIFGFNFTPDLSDGDMLGPANPPKHGQLRLEIRFANALDQSIHAIVYMEFDGNLVLDKQEVELQ